MMLCGGVAAASATNVVLLSVDTLRADRLGCYGYPLPTSPNLDAFSRNALLFENAVCEVPLTGPSMSAMLSSRYPRMTGTTRNGLRMPQDVPLVQEIFRDAGYQTFCIQSNWTLKSKLSRINRGFDHYDDSFHRKRWGLIKAERSGEEVTRLALDVLSKRDPDRPFFAWFHYSDPHAPYKLHRGFNPSGKPTRGLDRVERVRARYDSEVAYTDAQIQRVLEALPENTAVLFVADHGESLYEHDYLGHGRRVYQPEMRIPLMVRAPGLDPGRLAVPVRGIDVGPTLLGLAGLQPAEGMLGLDILKETIPLDRARVVETYGGAVPKLPGAKGLMAGSPPLRQAVILHEWKLILGGGEPQLFHLENDPGELDNLAGQQPGRVAELKAILESWDGAIIRAQEEGEELSGADIEALRSLGYIE